MLNILFIKNVKSRKEEVEELTNRTIAASFCNFRRVALRRILRTLTFPDPPRELRLEYRKPTHLFQNRKGLSFCNVTTATKPRATRGLPLSSPSCSNPVDPRTTRIATPRHLQQSPPRNTQGKLVRKLRVMFSYPGKTRPR